MANGATAWWLGILKVTAVCDHCVIHGEGSCFLLNLPWLPAHRRLFMSAVGKSSRMVHQKPSQLPFQGPELWVNLNASNSLIH